MHVFGRCIHASNDICAIVALFVFGCRSVALAQDSEQGALKDKTL